MEAEIHQASPSMHQPTHLHGRNQAPVLLLGVWREVRVLHCVMLRRVAHRQRACACVVGCGHPAHGEGRASGQVTCSEPTWCQAGVAMNSDVQ